MNGEPKKTQRTPPTSAPAGGPGPLARPRLELRSAYACGTSLLESDCDIRTIREGLAHTDVKTTIYPPAPRAVQDLTTCDCRPYAASGVGLLCRWSAAQRCYDETI